MPHGARHRFTPPAARPPDALERSPCALTRPLHALPKCRASRCIVLALTPPAQVLDPIKDLTPLRETPAPGGPCDPRVDLELIGPRAPAFAKRVELLGCMGGQGFVHRSQPAIECPHRLLDHMEPVQPLPLITQDLTDRRLQGLGHLQPHPLDALEFRLRTAFEALPHGLTPSTFAGGDRSTSLQVHAARRVVRPLPSGVFIYAEGTTPLAGSAATAGCNGPAHDHAGRQARATCQGLARATVEQCLPHVIVKPLGPLHTGATRRALLPWSMGTG
jgi:hypothetical protein